MRRDVLLLIGSCFLAGCSPGGQTAAEEEGGVNTLLGCTCTEVQTEPDGDPVKTLVITYDEFGNAVHQIVDDGSDGSVDAEMVEEVDAAGQVVRETYTYPDDPDATVEYVVTWKNAVWYESITWTEPGDEAPSSIVRSFEGELPVSTTTVDGEGETVTCVDVVRPGEALAYEFAEECRTDQGYVDSQWFESTNEYGLRVYAMDDGEARRSTYGRTVLPLEEVFTGGVSDSILTREFDAEDRPVHLEWSYLGGTLILQVDEQCDCPGG